jgi:DNA-binding CsgD family transcriptional regulator
MLTLSPVEHSHSTAAHLGLAYGLTASEAQVATNLADGYRLDEIAERRGVSIHTVRNQLK